MMRYGSVPYGSGREVVTLRILYVVKRVSGFLVVEDRAVGGRTASRRWDGRGKGGSWWCVLVRV